MSGIGFFNYNYPFECWQEPVIEFILLGIFTFVWWKFFDFKWPDSKPPTGGAEV